MRRSLLKGAKEYANEASINAFLEWLQNSGLPEAKDFATEYIHALNEYSKNETGLIRFRDRTFIPGVIKIFLWFFETTLDHIIEETKVDKHDQ